MKTLLTALLLIVGSVCMAQNATDFFNSAGNQFIDGNTEQALSTVNRGLQRYPGDEKLTKLLEELQKQQQQEQEQKEQEQKEQQQQQDQQQDQKDQQKKDQEQQQDDQQKQDQEQQDQEQQKDQEQKQEEKEGEENEEKKDEEKSDSEKSEEEKEKDEQKQKDDLEKFLEKLKEMKISPEKAQMILEAMKNNEIKYVQEKKRKATKRKDRTKPDW
jgi:hypothetical protein